MVSMEALTQEGTEVLPCRGNNDFTVALDMDSPKGAPLYILPAKSYMDVIFKKGTKGHVLS